MRPARHRGTHRERFSTSSMPRRSPAIRCQSSRSNGAPVRKTASGESRNPLRWRSPTFSLPDEHDREVLAQLIGASNGIFSARHATNTSRASFRLAGPLIGRVLPLIARSGRLYPPRWQRASGRSVAARLGSGETWTFQLDVELVPDGRIRVDGAFVRGDVEMPVTSPALLLSREFLIADDGVSRVDHRGAFAWVIELRKSGPAMIPAEAAPKLIKRWRNRTWIHRSCRNCCVTKWSRRCRSRESGWRARAGRRAQPRAKSWMPPWSSTTAGAAAGAPQRPPPTTPNGGA